MMHNINLNLTPKGSGVVMIDGTVGIDTGKIDLKNSGTASQILFYCESSNAHAQTLQGAPHSQGATNTLLLPDGGNGTLLSTVSTATLTNKTFGDNTSFGDNNITNVGDIALDTISSDASNVVTVADSLTVTGTQIVNAGVSVKNGATSAGFVEFFEDSDNGTNKVTLIGPASTADVTLTLPAAAGIVATTDDATALAIALG